jgi:hypothetical protein
MLMSLSIMAMIMAMAMIHFNNNLLIQILYKI